MLWIMHNISHQYCERLIIYSRWSRDRAIQYLQDYSAFTYASAANEIDRYITWPGQACAYKVGELKIRELRNHAEKELGNSCIHIIIKIEY